LAALQGGEDYDLAIIDLHMPEMDGVMLAVEIRQLREAARLPLVMLSSHVMTRRNIADLESEVEFAAYLTKPVKPAQLFNVLIGILAGESDQVALPVIKHQIDRHLAERLPLRILVAEDNLINQKVALRLLERMGYRAEVAGNGLEALAALRRQRYDIVLLDVQMPEMDGLEAAREIVRQWPKGQRPCIIAMTANAIRGDREECLAAGMDDYISKPVQITALQTALERAAQSCGTQTAATPVVLETADYAGPIVTAFD
jgi:CheY-like chemotaxis protein